MLKLRAVEPSDASLFFESENDEAIWAGSDIIAPYSMQVLEDYAYNYDPNPLAADQLRLIATLHDGTPVGILDFYEISWFHQRAFVGIYILRCHRRQGYALQLLTQATDYARRHLNINRLAARILAGNSPSLLLFQKAGYEHCGTLRDWHFSDGQMLDVHLLQHLPTPDPSE